MRDLNQVQRNCQFRSRAKTSKNGNNGLERKDWILKNHYTVSSLDEDVLRMETELVTRDVFNIVVSYFAGWRVESIRFENQILITLRLHKSSSCSIISFIIWLAP